MTTINISKEKLIETIIYHIEGGSEEYYGTMEESEFLNTVNMQIPSTDKFITAKELKETLEEELLGDVDG